MTPEKSNVFLLAIVLFLRIEFIDSVEACVKISPCSCQNSDGIIDLSPLAAAAGSDPRFKDVQDELGSYYYSWNPCNSFTEGDCKDVSGCQTDMSSYFSIGTEDSAQFVVDTTDGLYVKYTATTDATRTLNVYLKCDQSQEGKLDVKGEDPPSSATYKMTLTSKYACAASGGGGASGTLSAGSVIVIIFFSVLFVYLAAGIAFQIFIRKSSGKQVIPNNEAWSGFAGLVKDGVLFTVKCGKVSRSYNNI